MTQILPVNATPLSRHPRLVQVLRQLAGGKSEAAYRVETAKDGYPTLLVTQPDGREFTYHSRYQPFQEARKLVDSALSDQTHVIILGMGMGYALEMVLKKLSPSTIANQVIVVEPDPMVFQQALQSRDLKETLNDPRVSWCVGMTSDEVGEYWNSSLEWAVLDKLVILEHPPSIMRFSTYFERIKEKIRYFCNRSKGNLVTLMQAGSEFLTNNFLNMAAIASFPGIARFFGQFRDIPAIVVAAGPSLERNIHLLSEVKGRFLIIAVDTSFRQLMARGIRPDIVVAADPSYENSLDFVGVEDVDEVLLAVEPMTNPDILESFKGKKILMTFGGALAPWLEKFREPIGTVTSWGSIATTAFDLARKCGCDPIVFIGLDLSFQDGKLYARGSYSDDVFYDRVHPFTSLEHETSQYIVDRGIHRFPRPDGSILYTDQNMYLYKGWFEDQFRQTPAKIINATEGGIVDRFVENITLREVIDRLVATPTLVPVKISSALQKPVRVDLSGLLDEVRALLKDFRLVEKEVKEKMKRCLKLERTKSNLTLPTVSGSEKAEIDDAIGYHDQLCQKAWLFPWFSIHQAKFLTKHTMETNLLKNDPGATLESWAKQLAAFFEAMKGYFEYQIPLMESGLQSIENLRSGMVDQENKGRRENLVSTQSA